MKSIDFHPHGQSVVSGGHDAQIKFWDATPPETLDPPCEDRLPPVESPDGKRIASTNARNQIVVSDKASGEVLWKQLPNNGQSLKRLTWDPSSLYVLTDDSDILLARSADSGERHSDLKHVIAGRTSDVSPDGRFGAYASHPFYEFNRKGPIKIWDAIKNEVVLEFEAHADGVFGLKYSPDGKLLASVGLGEVKVWEASTGRQISAMYGHAPGQWMVKPAWSPDGKWLATSGWDQKVKVWDVLTGKQRWSLEGHVKSVFGMAFSPDGSRLVSGSGNGTLILWDLETGREVLKLNAWQEYPASRGLNPFHFEWSRDGRSFTARENVQRRGWKWDATRGFEIASRGEVMAPLQRAREILRGESAIQSFHANSAKSLALTLLLDPNSSTFDRERGLAEAEQAQRLNPVADTSIAMGLAQLRHKQWQSAIESLHNALSLDPNCVDVAGLMLAIAHAQLGQTDQATDWYLRAFDRLDSETDDAQDRLGNQMLGEADRLLRDALLDRCQRDLAALPEDLEQMHRAARLSIRFDRRQQAIELLTGITERSPHDLTSLSQLARLFGERAQERNQQGDRRAGQAASSEATQLLEQVIVLAEQKGLAKEQSVAEQQLAEHLLTNLVVWQPVDAASWVVGDGWKITVASDDFAVIRPSGDPLRKYQFRFPAATDGVMGIRLEELQQTHYQWIQELRLARFSPQGEQTPLEIDDIFSPSNDTRLLMFVEFHPTAVLDGDEQTGWWSACPKDGEQQLVTAYLQLESDPKLLRDTELEISFLFDKPMTFYRSRIWVTSDVLAAQVERIREVLRHSGARPEIQLAMAYWLHDRREAAESLVDQIDRDRSAALSIGEVLIMARLQAELGRKAEARQLLSQSVAQLPGRPLGFVLQFVANTRQLLLPALAEATPEDAPLLAAQAHLRARLFQANESRRLIDRVIELTPDDARAFAERAKLNLLTNQLPAAIADYRRVVELTDGNFDDRLRLAVLLLRSGDEAGYEALRRQTLSALESTDNPDRSAAILCLLRPSTEENHQQIQWLAAKIARQSPSDILQFFPIMLAQYRGQQWEDVMRTAETAMNLDRPGLGAPRTMLFQALLLKALCDANLGKTSDAERAFEEYRRRSDGWRGFLRGTLTEVDWLALFAAEVLETEWQTGG